MAAQQHPVVIVKNKRIARGDDEHYGGAWKVAFADFAIAMMALFMVLWIIAKSSQEERERLEQILQTSNVFELTNSPFMIDFGGDASPFENIVRSTTNGTKETGEALNQQIPEGDINVNAGKGEQLNSMLKGQHLETAQLMMLAKIMQGMVQELSASNNLVLQVAPQGLRVLIKDSENRIMFNRGSAQITPHFKAILHQLTPMLSDIKNRIVISGHTDSTNFKSDHYSNWELSAQRAMVARQVMLGAGLPDNNVMQVVAMSDRVLMDGSDPEGGQNRRIEIMVLTPEADKQLELLFGQESTRADFDEKMKASIENTNTPTPNTVQAPVSAS